MRTDIHRPSAIVPSQYEYVAIETKKIECPDDVYVIRENRDYLASHMAKTGGVWSDHQHGGNCHICGAHCIWTIVFWHYPSNTYIRCGSDCADKLYMNFNKNAFKTFKGAIKSAEAREAARRDAQDKLAEYGLSDAWDAYVLYNDMIKQHNDNPKSPLPSRDLNTLQNMVASLVVYKTWTEKQQLFVRKLLNNINGIQEEVKVDVIPATYDRITIQGKVLSSKMVETEFGYVEKTLIQSCEGNWKAYGTAPVKRVSVGATIKFVAAISPSKDDPCFGFWSRPSKGELIEN